MGISARSIQSGLETKGRRCAMQAVCAAVCLAWFALPAGAAPAEAAAAAARVTLIQDDARRWMAQPTWLSNPSSLACASDAEGGVRLSVGQLGGGMKWLTTLEAPVSTEALPWVSVSYRARHLPVRQQVWLQLGDGVETWQPLLSLAHLHDDGAWHVLTEKAAPIVVRQVVLEYQADSAAGFIEIGKIEFSAAKPQRTLGQVLAQNAVPEPPPSEAFQSLPLTGDVAASRWLAAAGLADTWFPHESITASGVPFRISTDPATAIAMTSVPELGAIQVPVGSAAKAIYLLMGAVFTGPESAAIGYGPRTRIRQSEHISLAVVYTDGQVERHFPVRFPSRGELITADPGVYVVWPTRDAAIERIELHDQIRNGAVALAGITLGPHMEPSALQAESGKATPAPAARRRPVEFHHTRVASDAVALDVEMSAGMLHAVVRRARDCQWLARPTPLYRLTGDATAIRAQLTATPLATGEIELRLTLTNTATQPVAVQPTFPLLENLHTGGDTARLGYVFPGQTAVIGTDPATLRGSYGGAFPVQFMAAYDGEAGGLYLATRDLSCAQKLYWLDKTDSIAMGVRYAAQTLAPGETWTLPPAVLGGYQGTWWEAVEAYRQWVATWYRAAALRPRWFREAFNFRQQFLTQKLPEASGMFDPRSKQFALAKVLAADAEAFGGVDMLHLFDWGNSPTHGRVGDYRPWDHLGPPEQLRRAIGQVQNAGTPVGLYFEGYLVSHQARINHAHGAAWGALTAGGKPYSPYGDSIVMCANEPPWQEYLAGTLGRVNGELGAKGYYVDEFGFGGQYPCHNREHHHPVPSNQLVGERECLQKVRSRLSPDTVIYTEEMPIDVATQYQEGAFSYAVRNLRMRNAPGQINLARFIWPEFKTFEILAVDAAVMDDLHGIKLVFFNGEGIWLEGTPPEAWFTAEALATIRKTHGLLRAHRQAFTSPDPRPLTPTLQVGIHANRFRAARETVWTLLNTTCRPVRSEIIAVEHVPGATYEDAWNGQPIVPRLHAGQAYLPVAMGPLDVGCIVQQRP